MSYRCLILSHAFNMDGRAASQTITDKIPYLLEKNWKLFVLSAVTGSQDLRFPHHQLFACGPSAFRFDFRYWYALRFGRDWKYRLATGAVSILLTPLIILEKLIMGLTNQWSWAVSATAFGVFWIRKHEINLIYSTGGAWSAHLAGYWLAKITGLRWIAEIHDPLVKRYDENNLRLKIGGTREEKIRQLLERVICKKASLCWWFTEGALRSAQSRNSVLGERGFFLLPGAQGPKFKVPYSDSDELSIGHFGSVSESRSLSYFIEALDKFIQINQGSRSKLKLHVYGGTLDQKSLETLKKTGIYDNVIVHGRLEYDPLSKMSGRDRVTVLMQKCSFLLLIHGKDESCSEYIPSKLYDYWWAQRPILAITYNNPQLNRLLKKISGLNKIGAYADEQQCAFELLTYAWDHQHEECIKKFQLSSPPLTPQNAVETIHNRLTTLWR